MRSDLQGRHALLYRRVSSDEQARHGHSLAAQDDAGRQFCAHHGVTVVGAYSDEGFSGRDFNRPDYRRMHAEHAAARGDGRADLLLITKWSRFARNVDEARSEIKRWSGLGVEVQAIEQWINYADPNHLYQLLINLVEPDVANRWLSINIRQGIRKAMLDGRWVNNPPVGYLRARDADGRPTLVPDPVQGPLVAAAFALAADGALALEDVYQRAKAQGLRVQRTRFYDLLRQAAYVGRIAVPERDGAPAQTVPAQHEPLVDEPTWARVQARFERPRRRGERGPDDRFPLRGLLHCPSCARPATASASAGRTSHYAYYHCGRCRGADGYRHRVEAVHDAFAVHLGGVRLAPAVAALWRELVGEMARDASADARRWGVELRRQRSEEDARRVRAEELYIDGKLDRAALDRASARADERLAGLDARLVEADAGADVEHAAHVRYAINVLADLPGLWERADAEGRRVLAGSIWPAGLVYDGDGFGTGPESPVIALFQGVGAETTGRRPSREDRRPVQWSVAESNR